MLARWLPSSNNGASRPCHLSGPTSLLECIPSHPHVQLTLGRRGRRLHLCELRARRPPAAVPARGARRRRLARGGAAPRGRRAALLAAKRDCALQRAWRLGRRRRLWNRRHAVRTVVVVCRPSRQGVLWTARVWPPGGRAGGLGAGIFGLGGGYRFGAGGLGAVSLLGGGVLRRRARARAPSHKVS